MPSCILPLNIKLKFEERENMPLPKDIKIDATVENKKIISGKEGKRRLEKGVLKWPNC